MPENLSEVLFSKKINIKETSTLIASSASKRNTTRDNTTMDGEEKAGWYRLMKYMQWAWQGIDIIDCYECSQSNQLTSHAIL